MSFSIFFTVILIGLGGIDQTRAQLDGPVNENSSGSFFGDLGRKGNFYNLEEAIKTQLDNLACEDHLVLWEGNSSGSLQADRSLRDIPKQLAQFIDSFERDHGSIPQKNAMSNFLSEQGYKGIKVRLSYFKNMRWGPFDSGEEVLIVKLNREQSRKKCAKGGLSSGLITGFFVGTTMFYQEDAKTLQRSILFGAPAVGAGLGALFCGEEYLPYAIYLRKKKNPCASDATKGSL